ncbi:MAG: tRNA 2-thiouridine(34) synthase MnmA [Candidatus Omnitrophica bacterium]|nr:tRNA 2-thiouridine(34) synthase MnmA [Candidatus Omnitrophota bacterium]
MKPSRSSQKNKKRVLVAMSGGVDSSVTAFLLKKRGYEVIGITMCFGLEDSKGSRPSCCSVSGIEDARRVAEQLGISHYVLSFGRLLKEKVIEDFTKEYLSGRTPNPCIRCNQYLKFDALVKKAKQLNCDYLATGHYARITHDKQDKAFLKRAKDTQKDQSYFLFRIPRDLMDFILFPLGSYTKQQVRKIAKGNKLCVADKPGSQDVCFIPNGNYRDFLKRRLSQISTQMIADIKPGPILDTKGNALGQHKGICFYTIGQRQGLGIAHKCALYVVKIDNKSNTLVVGKKNDVYKTKLQAKELHLLNMKSLPKRLEVKAKIRYNHPMAKAVIRPLERRKIYIEFSRPQWAITPGQSVVFYQNNVVIGGATIERVK